MIDLSFEFGIPASQLAKQMSYREFALYEAYAIKHMLPSRKKEVLLAQISFMLSKSEDATLSDFLFDYKSEDDEIKEFFEFKPRVK